MPIFNIISIILYCKRIREQCLILFSRVIAHYSFKKFKNMEEKHKFFFLLTTEHGGRILWRRCINFLLSYSYTSTWYFLGLYDNQVEPRQVGTSEFTGCRFDGPPIAARLYLTNSAKRKRRKPPRSATDAALGRLQ